MMPPVPRFSALAAALLVAACSGIHGEYPRKTAIIPDAAVRVSPSETIALEKIAVSAAAVALA